MPTPPVRTELADTYPNPNNATFRTGIGKLYDYVTALLGASGSAADARAAMGAAALAGSATQTFSAAAATAAAHATRADQIQLQSVVHCGTTGGSATAYTCAATPALAANTAKTRIRATLHTAAGATPTLAVNGLAALPIKYVNSAGALQAITATQAPAISSDFECDGTNWVMLNPMASQSVLRSYLAGCTMSTAGSSATMSIAAGQGADSTNAVLMNLSAIAKTTSAWAVGTAQGGLDTGTIANSTWYHFYVIRRPDTGVVDVCFSTNASTPTLPTNYTQYRRIGSGKTNGSAQWTSFKQTGDYFRLSASVLDVNTTNPGTSMVTATLASVPTGVKVMAIINANYLGSGQTFYIHDLDANDEAPQAPHTAGAAVPGFSSMAQSAASWTAGCAMDVMTNASAQIGYRVYTPASGTFGIITLGWYDRRGRDD